MTFLSVVGAGCGGRWDRSSPSLQGYDLSVQRMEGYEPAEEQRDLDLNGRRKKQRSCAECRQVVTIWSFLSERASARTTAGLNKSED